jgi:L-ornithine N5-oxygenase
MPDPIDSPDPPDGSPRAAVFDVVGLGFGPSNLALAVALRERDAVDGLRDVLFVESRNTFEWHPGMLFADARMQVSFLKDLVTLRNPRSPFSFLSYVWEQGRLSEFINLEDFRPTRREFTDYLRWAASQVGDLVRYSCEAVAVAPVAGGDGRIEALEVTVRDVATGRRETHRARNVVLGAGREPLIPAGVAVGVPWILHSQDFLPRIPDLFPQRDGAHRFVVVGDGQSAAEVFAWLAAEYPRARVTAALRGLAYRPMDDSPFVNEWFFPERVGDFYRLPPDARRSLLGQLRNTNYSVVDLQLIERIYRAVYDARVAGRTGLELLPRSELVGAQERDGRVVVELVDRIEGRPRPIEADALILATGFASPKRPALLDGLRPWLEVDDDGSYRVERSYRVRPLPGFEPGVYLQGYCQRSHGIADTLLSIVSIRAAEILDAIAGRSGAAVRRATPADGA